MKKREMKGRPREMRRKQGLWRGKEEEQRKRSEWKSELDNRKRYWIYLKNKQSNKHDRLHKYEGPSHWYILTSHLLWMHVRFILPLMLTYILIGPTIGFICHLHSWSTLMKASLAICPLFIWFKSYIFWYIDDVFGVK